MIAFFRSFIKRKTIRARWAKYISLERSFSDLFKNLTFDSLCLDMEEFMRLEVNILIL